MILGNALFYIALVALIASTFLSAGIGMTRATIHRLAQTYIAAGFARAQASLQQTLAAELQAGPLPSPLPTFTPLPQTCAAGPCAYKIGASIVFTRIGAPSVSSQCDQTLSNCAFNEQANAYVNEGRMTARITVTVSASGDGAVLVSRTQDVVLRTMSTPPYAVLAGTRDGSFGDVLAKHAAGDDGGEAASSVNPCASPAPPGTSDDTVVRVAYRNQTTNACSDGSTWRTQSYASDATGW